MSEFSKRFFERVLARIDAASLDEIRDMVEGHRAEPSQPPVSWAEYAERLAPLTFHTVAALHFMTGGYNYFILDDGKRCEAPTAPRELEPLARSIEFRITRTPEGVSVAPVDA